MANVFLQAEWRKLAMINYKVGKELLLPYLPVNTALDLWNDCCYVSLVGFMFLDTRIRGIKVPFHVNFEEINLRFYVRHQSENNWKRGVVFIKEIVSKAALTFVANTLYKENYATMPTAHSWNISKDSIEVIYKWKKKQWNFMKVVSDNQYLPIQPNSEEAFITEHYWGYAKIGTQGTNEYEVKHPQWYIYPAKQYEVNVDFESVYGKPFAFLKDEIPASVFLAEGSLIEVMQGKRI